MKNLRLIVAGLLFSCSLFAISPAKAGGPPPPTPEKNVPGGSETLPINTQAWLLLIAGAGIGCYVIVKKNKTGIKVAVQTIN